MYEPAGTWRRGTGKLHVTTDCARATSVVSYPGTVSEINASDLCRTCAEDGFVALPGSGLDYLHHARMLLSWGADIERWQQDSTLPKPLERDLTRRHASERSRAAATTSTATSTATGAAQGGGDPLQVRQARERAEAAAMCFSARAWRIGHQIATSFPELNTWAAAHLRGRLEEAARQAAARSGWLSTPVADTWVSRLVDLAAVGDPLATPGPCPRGLIGDLPTVGPWVERAGSSTGAGTSWGSRSRARRPARRAVDQFSTSIGGKVVAAAVQAICETWRVDPDPDPYGRADAARRAAREAARAFLEGHTPYLTRDIPEQLRVPDMVAAAAAGLGSPTPVPFPAVDEGDAGDEALSVRDLVTFTWRYAAHAELVEAIDRVVDRILAGATDTVNEGSRVVAVASAHVIAAETGTSREVTLAHLARTHTVEVVDGEALIVLEAHAYDALAPATAATDLSGGTGEVLVPSGAGARRWPFALLGTLEAGEDVTVASTAFRLRHEGHSNPLNLARTVHA